MPFSASAAVPLQSYIYGPLPSEGRLIWVAPNGNDVTGTGSEARPYATPGVASTKAAEGDTIVLKNGTYGSFGTLRRSGTAVKPIVLRPQSGGRAVFDLRDGSSAEIAGSHWRIFGLEIHERNAATKGACLVITREVQNLNIRDLDIHDCDTGVQLSQTGSAVRGALFADVRVHDVDRFGFRCSVLPLPEGEGAAGPCDDVTLERVQIANVRGVFGEPSAGIWFEGAGDRLTVTDSEITNVQGGEGTGLSVSGADPIMSNTAISEIAAFPLELKKGGAILNSDIRGAGYGVRLRGGATYRLRGNLIADVGRKGRDWPVAVFYGRTSADQVGAMLLQANRIASEDGNLGLPVSSTVASPLLVTLHGNTFFFAKAADGAELPAGRFVPAASFASATGTGIVNTGGNISVVGRPLAEDLVSPIYTGGNTYDARADGSTLIFSGARMKGSGPAVYLYGVDGKRHAFPNEATYRSWFRDFSDIAAISDDALARISLGRNVTSRPGMRLLKITTDPRVYAVADGAVLRWVQTEEAALALFGADWNKQVDDLPDAFFTNYSIGAPIASAADYHAAAERAEIVNPAELF